MPQQIAVVFALCAFSVSVSCGLLSAVASDTVLLRSLVVLVATYAIGRALGIALTVALNEHLTAATAADPIPEQLRVAARGTEGAGRADANDIVESV
jgi:hypothetical protein